MPSLANGCFCAPCTLIILLSRASVQRRHAAWVIVLSDRPARIKGEVVNDRPYPRHRGDPHLARLRHALLAHLGLDATW